MMIGDAMTPLTPFDPVLVFFSMLFNFEFNVTVFDVPVFDITLLYPIVQCLDQCFSTGMARVCQQTFFDHYFCYNLLRKMRRFWLQLVK